MLLPSVVFHCETFVIQLPFVVMTKIAFVLATLIGFMLLFGVDPQPPLVFTAWVLGCIAIFCRQFFVEAKVQKMERERIRQELETEGR